MVKSRRRCVVHLVTVLVKRGFRGVVFISTHRPIPLVVNGSSHAYLCTRFRSIEMSSA